MSASKHAILTHHGIEHLHRSGVYFSPSLLSFRRNTAQSGSTISDSPRPPSVYSPHCPPCLYPTPARVLCSRPAQRNPPAHDHRNTQAARHAPRPRLPQRASPPSPWPSRWPSSEPAAQEAQETSSSPSPRSSPAPRGPPSPSSPPPRATACSPDPFSAAPHARSSPSSACRSSSPPRTPWAGSASPLDHHDNSSRTPARRRRAVCFRRRPRPRGQAAATSLAPRRGAAPTLGVALAPRLAGHRLRRAHRRRPLAAGMAVVQRIRRLRRILLSPATPAGMATPRQSAPSITTSIPSSPDTWSRSSSSSPR